MHAVYTTVSEKINNNNLVFEIGVDSQTPFGVEPFPSYNKQKLNSFLQLIGILALFMEE